MDQQPLRKYLLGLALSAATVGSFADDIDFQFSGFGRIVAGQISDSEVSYAGYDNGVTIDQNSLLGLQGQLKFNDEFSATALGLLHSDDNESGLEWLYLSYRATSALNIKVGQMQTPFYSISDSLDVGFSYPWVLAPREVYNDSVFENFQGIDIRYTLLFDDITTHFETYYGRFDGQVNNGDEEIDAKVDGMKGFIGELRYSNFSFRGSYHLGDVDLKIREIDQFAAIFSQSGFNRTAQSLNPDGETKISQLSAEYDSLKYYLKSEIVNIDIASRFLPDFRSHYLTVGRYFDNLTALITYARSKNTLVDGIDEIPLGLSPQLDQLALAYQNIYATRTFDDIESWTAGLRWNFRPNFSLKAEYKNIKSHSPRPITFMLDDNTDFDHRTSLMLVGLDWIF